MYIYKYSIHFERTDKLSRNHKMNRQDRQERMSIPNATFQAMRLCLMAGFVEAYNSCFPNVKPDQVDPKYHNFARNFRDIASSIVNVSSPLNAEQLYDMLDSIPEMCDSRDQHVETDDLYNALRHHPTTKHAIYWCDFFTQRSQSRFIYNLEYMLLSLELRNPILYFDTIIKYYTDNTGQIISVDDYWWGAANYVMASRDHQFDELYMQLQQLLESRHQLEMSIVNLPNLGSDNQIQSELNANLANIRTLHDETINWFRVWSDAIH